MSQNLHKIIFAGLNSVGKTSIYKKVIEHVDIQDLENLPPTRGIERRVHALGDHSIIFWDLGGQKSYRLNYFTDSRIFEDTSVLIYVIDIQDKVRFDESIEYLLQILMTIKHLANVPKIYVLLHKYDPNLVHQLRTNIVELSTILREANKIPSMTISKFATSIYSENMDDIFEHIVKQIIPDFTNEMITGIKKEPSSTTPTVQSSMLPSEVPLNLDPDKNVDFKDQIMRHFENIASTLFQQDFSLLKKKDEDTEEEEEEDKKV